MVLRERQVRVEAVLVTQVVLLRLDVVHNAGHGERALEYGWPTCGSVALIVDGYARPAKLVPA